ncbi:hypothetical protein EYC84_003341 [Monilinia fructicola]|uniref:CST complex subunit Stn1 N-terminal domain-containing protein n=1 Tax=Monilinia fructicola TaxID=38448 RepID=A0A5M9JXY1_MONFR|nr:hypothetical protein EYC84_003341 [Monilinia fructicola]
MEFMGIVIFDLAGWIRYALKRALVTTMIQHEDFSISTTASKPFSIRPRQPSAPNHNHKFWTNSLPTLNFTHHTNSHLITTFSTVSHPSHDAPEENVMSTPSSTSNLAPLQPPNLYHLSPTYQKWCALRCADIITLKDRRVYVEGKLIHHYLNHPIRYVKLIGLIVSMDDFAHRRVYTLDDSSGACIECVALLPSSSARAASQSQPAPPPEPSIEHPQVPWADVQECKVVRVLGVVGTYMTRPQLHIVKMGVVGTTELERRWWDECARLKREVLGREWRVSREEVARWERRERRRGERERERERERGRGAPRGREAGARTEEGDGGGKRAKRETSKKDKLAHEKPHPLTREQEEKRPVIPKRKEAPNSKPKDPRHLLEIATHPSTSTSTSKSIPNPNSNPPSQPPPQKSPSNKSTSKSKSKSKPEPEPPTKKRIIPVVLTDLAKFDTFGL